MKKLLCIIGIIFATMMSTTAFAEMFSFQSVLGVNDISDIQSAVIVGDNGKCADIEQEDLQQWLNVYWNFQGYEPVILPQSNNGYYYIKLWNKDKTKSYVVNANSGILVGRYGEPSKSHGEVKENYLWYFPYIGNARNALYMKDITCVMLHLMMWRLCLKTIYFHQTVRAIGRKKKCKRQRLVIYCR